MLSAAIVTITRLSTPISVLTSASDRLGRSASGSFLRSITRGCGFCSCDCASVFFASVFFVSCADSFEDGGCCAAVLRPNAISSAGVIKTILFIFVSVPFQNVGTGSMNARAYDPCSAHVFGWIQAGIIAHGGANRYRVRKLDRLIDALHLSLSAVGGDSRFARFPIGNHPRKARPAFDVQCRVVISMRLESK